MLSIRKYIQLTKPTIILLVAITGMMTMAAEGTLFTRPVSMLLCLLAIMLSAGSANAFNQFIDRDIDSIMDRTRKRRPLPLDHLTPARAFIFALILGVASNVYLWIKFTPLASLISVGTILFYIFVYTLWLKRRHYYNIVIGGAAGATAPLIASAAANGKISVIAWVGFLIIFIWTPPHFWALALAIKDEYAKVKIPMLPNVLGDKRTRFEILIYTVLLLPITLIPVIGSRAGWFYIVAAVLLWIWYMKGTIVQFKVATIASYKKLFYVSIGYLFFLFIAFGVDGAIRYWSGS
ncbi:MAG: ctaB [Bacteriovoracaceae bacterium]|nr:ctaB [Bacteriovoracaceae bacterium]